MLRPEATCTRTQLTLIVIRYTLYGYLEHLRFRSSVLHSGARQGANKRQQYLLHIKHQESWLWARFPVTSISSAVQKRGSKMMTENTTGPHEKLWTFSFVSKSWCEAHCTFPRKWNRDRKEYETVSRIWLSELQPRHTNQLLWSIRCTGRFSFTWNAVNTWYCFWDVEPSPIEEAVSERLEPANGFVCAVFVIWASLNAVSRCRKTSLSIPKAAWIEPQID